MCVNFLTNIPALEKLSGIHSYYNIKSDCSCYIVIEMWLLCGFKKITGINHTHTHKTVSVISHICDYRMQYILSSNLYFQISMVNVLKPTES